MDWPSYAPSDEPLKTVVLEKLKLHFVQQMNMRSLSFVRNHAELIAEIDDMKHRLVAHIVTCVLAKERTETEEGRCQVPADWWQHLRQRWFPAWWLLKYPVRNKEIKWVKAVRTYHCCPHLDISSSNRNVHIDFLVSNRP